MMRSGLLCCLHFNPLSPHGERPMVVVGRAKGWEISIHSPRMGRDPLLTTTTAFMW